MSLWVTNKYQAPEDRTYRPPRLSDRAERALSAMPAPIPMESLKPQGRNYELPERLPAKKVIEFPKRSGGRPFSACGNAAMVRAALAQLRRGDAEEIHRCICRHGREIASAKVRRTISTLAHQGHLSRVPGGRYELTAKGRAAVEGCGHDPES